MFCVKTMALALNRFTATKCSAFSSEYMVANTAEMELVSRSAKRLWNGGTDASGLNRSLDRDQPSALPCRQQTNSVYTLFVAQQLSGFT